MPLELSTRNTQARARSRNKMAALMLSVVKAASGIWGAKQGSTGLGRERGPFALQLLALAFPAPWKWGQKERRKGEHLSVSVRQALDS